jgi:hypothetical protein
LKRAVDIEELVGTLRGRKAHAGAHRAAVHYHLNVL